MSEKREDRELERLLDELAPTAEAREALLEEHRQLEKDLARLADPLPPADFLSKVMAKVDAAPKPLRLRAEVTTAVTVLGLALGAAVVVLLASGSAGAGFGEAMAQLAVSVREVVVGVGSALSALWRTAAVPMAATLSMMLVASLWALKRFTVTPARTR